MASKTQVNVEKVFDRGPHHGFVEVQVNFEEKSLPSQESTFAYVIVSLPKAKVGSMSFDEIRAMAMSKAVAFMDRCVKNSAS